MITKGASVGSFGSILVAFGSILGRVWIAFGSTLSRCWVAFGSLLGRFWVDFGWLLGRFWVDFESLLGCFWTGAARRFLRTHSYRKALAHSLLPKSPSHSLLPESPCVPTPTRKPLRTHTYHVLTRPRPNRAPHSTKSTTPESRGWQQATLPYAYS